MSLGPTSNFIPVIYAGTKKKTKKIKKVISGIQHTFKKGKQYGEKDILNGGEK